MVGCSDLAFRLLCRRHGADLCYTEMFFADRFVSDAAYRDSVFYSQLAPDRSDRPLVVQFGGNDAPTLIAAALLVQDSCDAVDLNLGCPQKRVRELMSSRAHLVYYQCAYTAGSPSRKEQVGPIPAQQPARAQQ